MAINGASGLFTIREAAVLLHVSLWTISEHIRKHRVKTTRVGTILLVRLEDLGDLRVPLRVLRG
jgi:excisionase family DNA binding protein